MRPSHLIPALAAAVAITVAGCGNTYDDKRDSAATAGTSANAETPADTTEAAPPAPKEVSKDPKVEPKLPKPEGEQPTKLETEDIIVGKGKAAKKGDALEVDYVGIVFSTGEEFETSWGSQPIPFTLGEGGVIEGWDKGIVGMKVGGRRVLTIPADQAYGEQGSPPNIGPNEALQFAVDLKKIG